MAGERELPGIGLTGFWAEGSNGWKAQMDANLRKLSAFVQTAVESTNVPIPASSPNGTLMVVPATATENANAIAARDNGAWVYFAPVDGMLIYAKDTTKHMAFVSGKWAALAMDSGGDAEGPGPHTVWRLMLNTVSGNVRMVSVEFYGHEGGPLLSKGGSPFIAGKSLSNAQTIFDENYGDTLLFSSSEFPLGFQYSLPAAAQVGAVGIQWSTAGSTPLTATLQYQQGSGWVDAAPAFPILGTPGYYLHVFPWAALPVPAMPGLGEGDAGKHLAVKADGSGLEWVTPPTGGGGDGEAELPAYVDQGGKHLAVKADGSGLEWVTPPTGGGDGGAPAPIGFGEHPFWRIRRTASPSDQFVGMGELVFEGADTTGGSVIFSTQYDDSSLYRATNAFDGNPSNYWVTLTGAAQNAYIGYHFPQPVGVTAVTLSSGENSSRAGYMPTGFVVQYSDDGAIYKDAWGVTTDAWGTNQSRRFEAPAESMEYVLEAPKDGTPYARQDGGWVPAPQGGGDGGGGETGYLIGSVFSEYPQPINAVYSTSAYSVKGNTLVATSPTQIAAARVTVAPDAAGQTYRLGVFAVDSQNVITRVIALSDPIVSGSAGPMDLLKVFDAPYTAPVGQRIAVVAAKIGGSTEVTRVNFPGVKPTVNGIIGFDFVGAIREAMAFPTTTGLAIPNYASDTHVPMGLLVLLNEIPDSGDGGDGGTELPGYSDQGGKILAVKSDGSGLEWVDKPVPGSNDGGGGSTDPNAHRYWRLLDTEHTGVTYTVRLRELQFRGVVGGPNLVGAGTPVGVRPADQAAAFDAVTSTYTELSGRNVPNDVAYDFGEPVLVAEVYVDSTGSQHRLKKGSIQYSDDGAGWFTALEYDVTNEGVIFSLTLPWGLPARPEMPYATVDHAGKHLAVKADGSGVEWVAPESGGGDGDGGEGVAPFSGALIRPTTVQNYPAGAWTTTRFAEKVYATEGWWSEANPNKFVVPPGVSKIRLAASVMLDASDPMPVNNSFRFTKNGQPFTGGPKDAVAVGYNNTGMSLASSVVEAVAGDVFALEVFAAESFALAADSTSFSVEAVEVVATNAKLSGLLDTEIVVPQPGQSLIWDADLKKWKPGVPVVAANVAQGVNKPFRGAMAIFSANKNIPAPMFPVIWDAALYDTDGLWSAASPGRLTIPAGVKKVRLSACLAPGVATLAGTENYSLAFRKNGALGPGLAGAAGKIGYSDSPVQIDTPVLPVQAGDYFELRWNLSTSATQIMGTNSYFAIEIVEVETAL